MVLAAALLLGMLAAGGLGYGAGYQVGVDTGTTSSTTDTTTVAPPATTTDTTPTGTTAPSATTTTETATTTTTTSTTSSTETTSPSTTTSTTTATPPPPGSAQTETAQPGQAGSLTVTSAQTGAQVSVRWTDTTFTAPTTLTVDPAPSLGAGVTLLGARNVLVRVVAAGATGAVTSFATPLELVFAPSPAGYVPVVSEDGVHFRALVRVAGPPLPPSMSDGYYVSLDGLHVLTRHLTIFALLAPANASKWGDVAHKAAPTLTVVDKPSLAGVRLTFVASVDAPATLTAQVLAGSRMVATKSISVRLAGAVPFAMRVVRVGQSVLTLVVTAVNSEGGKTVKRLAVRA